MMSVKHILATASLLLQPAAALNLKSNSISDILKRWHSSSVSSVDVLIVGGGSSGMYSAVRLHQMNKTIAVIEPQNKTGGHVETYHDPRTGKSFDVGVLYYHNISVVTDYAAYVGVPMAADSLTTSNQNLTHTIDFSTGEIVPGDKISALGDLTSSFLSYYSILQQYPYLLSGFHLPSPLPDDFTMSWRDFIVKHNLGGLAFSVDLFNQGWKDILDMPTLYILKGFGSLLLQSFFSGYELNTASGNNQDLFDNAVKKIGPEHVYLNSRVQHIQRTDNGVTAIIDTPHGPRFMHAKKLLITAPPLLSNLKPMMHLDEQEEDIFGKLSCGYYWNAVLDSAGLSDGAGLYNAGLNNPYYIADQPGILTIIPSGLPHLHRVYYGSPNYMTNEAVVDSILSTTQKALEALNVTDCELDVPFIRSHAPYHCTVTSDDIKSGFYDKLNALQGQKSTWYTGATFQAHDSGSIWLYTEKEILPALLA